MKKLAVSASLVHLIFRHSRSLKDKRQSVQSIIQKLRNEGFSATEVGFKDDPKQGCIGFSFVGADPDFVEEKRQRARFFFEGDFQIGQTRHENYEIDMEGEQVEIPWEEEYK